MSLLLAKQIENAARPSPLRLGPWSYYQSWQGVTISTGVSQWNDLSGNNRHQVQPTAGAQFAWTQSSTYGRKVLDGTADGKWLYETTNTTLVQPFTVVAIGHTTDNAIYRAFWGCGATDTAEGFSRDGVSARLYCASGPGIYVNKSLMSPSAVIWVANGSTSSVYVIGKGAGSGTSVTGSTGTNAMTRFCVGAMREAASYCLLGHIAEIGAFARAFNASEVAYFQNYALRAYPGLFA